MWACWDVWLDAQGFVSWKECLVYNTVQVTPLWKVRSVHTTLDGTEFSWVKDLLKLQAECFVHSATGPHMLCPYPSRHIAVWVLLSYGMSVCFRMSVGPSTDNELMLYRVLDRANLTQYYDAFISQGKWLLFHKASPSTMYFEMCSVVMMQTIWWQFLA